MPTYPTFRITITLSSPELRALRHVLEHVVDNDDRLAAALGSRHRARFAAARSMHEKMRDANAGAMRIHLYPRQRDGALRQEEALDLRRKVSALMDNATSLATRIYDRRDAAEVHLASKMMTSALSLQLLAEQIQKRLAR